MSNHSFKIFEYFNLKLCSVCKHSEQSKEKLRMKASVHPFLLPVNNDNCLARPASAKARQHKIIQMAPVVFLLESWRQLLHHLLTYKSRTHNQKHHFQHTHMSSLYPHHGINYSGGSAFPVGTMN